MLRQRERERDAREVATRDARRVDREPDPRTKRDAGPRDEERRGALEKGARSGAFRTQRQGLAGRDELGSARKRVPNRGWESSHIAEPDGGRARAWGASASLVARQDLPSALGQRPSLLGEAPRAAEEAPRGSEFVATPNAVAAALLSGSRRRVSALYLQNDRDDLFPEEARKELEDRARQLEARVHHISREGLVSALECTARLGSWLAASVTADELPTHAVNRLTRGRTARTPTTAAQCYCAPSSRCPE